MARTLRYSTEVNSFFPAAAAEGSVAGLEAPGDEGGESAGFFLQFANDFKVIDALIESFANTEHHGGRGAHAELMGGAMHGYPVRGAALEAGYSFSPHRRRGFRRRRQEWNRVLRRAGGRWWCAGSSSLYSAMARISEALRQCSQIFVGSAA